MMYRSAEVVGVVGWVTVGRLLHAPSNAVMATQKSAFLSSDFTCLSSRFQRPNIDHPPARKRRVRIRSTAMQEASRPGSTTGSCIQVDCQGTSESAGLPFRTT